MLNSVCSSCSITGSSDGPCSQNQNFWASSLFFISFFGVRCFLVFSFHLVLTPSVDTNAQFHNYGQFQLNFLHVISGDWQQIFCGEQNLYNNFPLKYKFGVLTASLLFKLMGTLLNSTLHRFAPEIQPRHYHFATDEDNFGTINVLKGLREVAITLRSDWTWCPRICFPDRYRLSTVSGEVLLLNRSGVLSYEDHCRW